MPHYLYVCVYVTIFFCTNTTRCFVRLAYGIALGPAGGAEQAARAGAREPSRRARGGSYLKRAF